MQVAIYARVSTERQERQATIASQLTLLRAWVAAGGYELGERHVFIDAGYSGARLDRPGLDRLRDAARELQFETVAVLSPDRLARRYAYQVLLLEELGRVGCRVVFLQHPISDDPNDQLLLQIQGAIAEYERAVLGERFRRGKLQKARSGQYVGGKAPYGYRYVPRTDTAAGHLLIDEVEADLVRQLYRWLVDERLSLRQILKRLNFGPWRPRSGKRVWSQATVHHILSDPIYTGTAYANRYQLVPPKTPRAAAGPRTREATCRRLKPQEEWIPIPVPALIDLESFGQAQAQLARNAALSSRHNTKQDYLLRCLLTCGVCGLAMFGKTYAGSGSRPGWRYYQCHGKDRILRDREQICPRRAVRADELEAAVWAHVAELLGDPEQLLRRYQEFAQAALDGDEAEQAERRRLQARLAQIAREDTRLLDAYQAEVITLEQLVERRQGLAQRRRGLEQQRAQQDRLRQERAHAQAVLSDLTAFCGRIRSRLADATFADKQAILQLLIEGIIVTDGRLEIRHVIPLGNAPPGNEPWHRADLTLRPDGVRVAQGPPLRREPAVHRPAVRPHQARERFTHQRHERRGTTPAVNQKGRQGRRHRRP